VRDVGVPFGSGQTPMRGVGYTLVQTTCMEMSGQAMQAAEKRSQLLDLITPCRPDVVRDSG